MARFLLLNITTYCNALCRFCIVFDSLNNPDLNMTDEQIFGTLKQAREEGAEEVGYSGGEPSVHPRFIEIVRTAKELGYTRQSFNTNGLKLRKAKYCRELVAAGMSSIDFSIHGHTDELHDELVARKNALKSIREAMGHLRALKEEFNFHLSATTVITASNHGHLVDICRMLVDMGFGNIRLKYAYEGNLDHEVIKDHVARYQEVVPSIRAAIEFLAQRPQGFHITHIPHCLLGDHAAFSRDWEHRDTLMVFKREAEVGDAAHRFRKDGDVCGGCVVRNVCTRLDGKYQRYHGRPDLRPFKTMEDVEALFDRAEARFGVGASLVRRNREIVRRNIHAEDLTPQPVAAPIAAE